MIVADEIKDQPLMVRLLTSVLVIAALVFSSFCPLYGYLHSVDGKVYSGIRRLNASDFNVDASWVGQCREGTFLLKNLYDPAARSGFLVRPLYFLFSIPFSLSSLSNAAVLHILRVIFGFGLLVALFPLLKIYIPEERMRLIAFFLLAFTSGAGLWLKTWIPDPADLRIPESNLFLTLGEPPHFIYSLLLLWAGLGFFYRRRLLLIFPVLFLLWFEHPFDAVSLIAITCANLWLLSGWKERSIFVSVIAAASIGPVAYYLYLSHQASFAHWASQNVLLTPHFFALSSAFLFLGIGGCFSIRLLLPTNRRLLCFLLVWIGAQFVLCYLPFPFQRRLIDGVQFPFVVLAAYGIARIKQPVILGTLLLFLTATNFFVMFQQTEQLRSRQMPYFLPVSYPRAFEWLSKQRQKDPVLSGYVSGNFIPAYSLCPVYQGHLIQTPDIQEHKRKAAQFFANPDPEFLKENDIRYIFFGLEEKHLAAPHFEQRFKHVYDDQNVSILDARGSL